MKIISNLFTFQFDIQSQIRNILMEKMDNHSHNGAVTEEDLLLELQQRGLLFKQVCYDRVLQR